MELLKKFSSKLDLQNYLATRCKYELSHNLLSSTDTPACWQVRPALIPSINTLQLEEGLEGLRNSSTKNGDTQIS